MDARILGGGLIALLSVSPSSADTPLSPAFTYQGKLDNNANPANGLHDLRFRLYGTAMDGAQVGATVCADNVSVTDGLFTVSLDFGAQFGGQERFLEIDVRADTGLDCADSAGFVMLTPRQALTAAPNALFTLNADRLDDLDSSAFLRSVPNPLTLSGTNDTHIIRGENASTVFFSAGVHGRSSSAGGVTYGVYGVTDSMFGAGVYGETSAVTGGSYGGRFQSYGEFGTGVYGYAGGPGESYGVSGRSDGTSGRGVYGHATWTGVTGNIYGVLGQASTFSNGFGVYAQGRLGASGPKSFRIDHPDDPEKKYLLHYSVESPEVLNAYSGKATLDGVGEAVVELPHYFAKINKDPRYMLTAIGAPMPMMHVAEEIDQAALSAGAKAGPGEAAPVCSFRIAGGVPGAKVSWEVKAVRNDRWVQLRGAPVEVEKQDQERGTYQHPELYGQPPEKGMNYEAKDAVRPSPAAASDISPRTTNDEK